MACHRPVLERLTKVEGLEGEIESVAGEGELLPDTIRSLLENRAILVQRMKKQ